MDKAALSLSRRAALAAGFSLAPAVAAGGVPLPPDAALLALARAWTAICGEIDDLVLESPESENHLAELMDARDVIATRASVLPATTAQGAYFKLCIFGDLYESAGPLHRDGWDRLLFDDVMRWMSHA